MTSIMQLLARQQSLQYQQRTVKPGGEWLAKARIGVVAELNVKADSGTVYPMFVLGAHNPDDAATARLVP